jgi:hypothetical protein
MAQNRSTAVMANRREAPDALDFFPTPPWATRALCEHLDRWGDIGTETVWDPACGEGDMARPLAEHFRRVHASDVHDYGRGQDHVCDFLTKWDHPRHIYRNGVDWVITNPPFKLAEAFALMAFKVARQGVALLVRTAFLEGGGRFERLFRPHRPDWILQFCERVPMFKGRLDPTGSTATAYCWIVWTSGIRRNIPAEPWDPTHFPAFVWLPPCRSRLERPGDYPAPGADDGDDGMPLFLQPWTEGA